MDFDELQISTSLSAEVFKSSEEKRIGCMLLLT
jgi:hypothetical protein